MIILLNKPFNVLSQFRDGAKIFQIAGLNSASERGKTVKYEE